MLSVDESTCLASMYPWGDVRSIYHELSWAMTQLQFIAVIILVSTHPRNHSQMEEACLAKPTGPLTLKLLLSSVILCVQ